jgi:glutamate synthase (NADPH/NADH) small chain
MLEQADIAAGRLPPAELAANFADAHPPLTADEALVEASRCYFCHDAPCTEACPTDIDVPGFIRRIATGNTRGAAATIFAANILGGSCARVCPTEILCEQACVRLTQEHRPVNIGALQRHATDWMMDRAIQPFTRKPETGRRVAVVGSGPAGLACAHHLAREGHAVTLFEARARPGGLTEYGIAAYKVADDFARREIDWLLGIGGIEIRCDTALGRDISLAGLRAEFDAVFLAIGLGGVRALGLTEETLAGVQDAVDFIAGLRQASDPGTVAVGRRVVVIGGGNTAIDAASQSRRLGAAEVTMVYRRGPAQMSATAEEQDWARSNGVVIRHHASPVALLGAGGHVTGVRFAGADGEAIEIPADMVLKAIGQVLAPPPDTPAIEAGRIAVDPVTRETSLPGVFAGGDCIAGVDLTVQAVQDGKLAAQAIHRRLSA